MPRLGCPFRRKARSMEFCSFDESYVERLRAGDFRTQEHFVAYFSELIKVKLRSRVRSPEAIEDIRQETFSRVLTALRSPDGLRQPDRLGVFVNSTCNNVLLEYYRSSARHPTVDDDAARPEPADPAPDALSRLATSQIRQQVQRALDGLPERDRRIIRQVLLEERSKDEVCREMGVDRDYLRVLVHRAKQSFKEEYLQQTRELARTARKE
jgi:RNA polymerase sigma-70 factor (ECF subfamily)